MVVEVVAMVLKTPVRVGRRSYFVDQAYAQARVYVDGEQVGLTMTDPDDQFFRVLHPLSRGYPKEFLQMVVDNSGGQLVSTLNGPVPMEEEPEQDDE